MISAIVPAKNEAGRATTVLQNLAQLPIDHIIFVVNGCRDTTVHEAANLRISNLHFIYFHECLGIDIPRAIGAKIAMSLGSDFALFVDGDMVGDFNEQLGELIGSMLIHKLDLGLTNCYPNPPLHIEQCNPTFQWRLNLNKELRLDQKIGFSSPAHGPHAISRKLMQSIALHELAIPPVMLALAKKHKLKIDIATTIPHYMLGSAVKNRHHSAKIVDTIVGDCLEGIAAYHDQPRARRWQKRIYTGYHAERRFDILDEFLTKI